MKLRIASLTILLLALVAIPAAADTIYDNGAINGQVDGWTINFGYTVSDNFTVPAAGAQVTGLSFGAWLFPGDTLTSVDVSITSSEFGGTTYFSGTVNFTASNCFNNTYGYNVCTETGSITPTNLDAGTYWLNMQNAVAASGGAVYWDENSGPSSASESAVGTIPSEAFTILGTGVTTSSTTSTTTTTTSGGTTPEPSSILLLGSGALGLAGLLRRKLF